MPTELDTRYNPDNVEDRIYKMWEDKNLFASKPNPDKKPYTIVIPPPNVTGALHMGHALNNTIQDILIRWRRMQGHETLWMPGTDHAGIATQNVVERALKKEGKTRHDVGRETLVNRIWDWKAEYGSRIINQLKKLGSSCDWQRERFTMDDGLSAAVKENFINLFKKDLIYRGNYLVNWCPQCTTALADDEVEHSDDKGHMWHMRYPLTENPNKFLIVATTRPETMFGDTAVAVSAKDERYKDLIGKTITLPFVNRQIPIIADEHVDSAFGTGAVKVTPAHDPNDWQIGKRHNLAEITVMDEHGIMNNEAGVFANQDRFTCRKNIIKQLDELGLLEKIEDHDHSVGHCYRCDTVIESRLSKQWFVKMKPLAEAAIAKTNAKELTFHPNRWEKVYMSWLENVRDWCISRQIWWGHRIPIWYCEDCNEVIPSADNCVEICPKCQSTKLHQDPDVLDTWFSSALWPFSTLGWPENTKELDYYYPTNTLVTDRGIIYFWVARMVMMGLENIGQIPFKDVYIHGTILDEQGRKMSKSLGNGIDPLEMIKKYSADAVRFSIISLTTEGQDVKLSPTKFEMGRNFTNKLWNASRFVLINLEGFEKTNINYDDLTFADKWILSNLNKTIAKVSDDLENFHFNQALNTTYDFVWNQFCSWYLEITKPIIAIGGDDKIRSQQILAHILDSILRLLHPIVPFITEELWEKLAKIAPVRDLISTDKPSQYIINAPWPMADQKYIDTKLHSTMDTLQDIIRAVRTIRNQTGVGEKIIINSFISANNLEIKELVDEHKKFITYMANCTIEALDINLTQPHNSAVEVTDSAKIFVALEGLIDNDAEREKIKKEIDKVSKGLKALSGKLNNQKFISNAPEAVVKAEQARQAELQEKLNNLEDSFKALA